MIVQEPVATDHGIPETEQTDDQRLTRLEKNIFLNRTLLLLVTVILTVATTASTTYLLYQQFNDDSHAYFDQHIAVLNQEIAALKQQNQFTQLQLEQLQQALPVLETRLENSSATTFQKLLVEQEISFQKFLAALKTGMRDLSHMVPGSRTWLEHYQEQLNGALEQSLRRQKELQKLQTGEQATP